jgi:hypothetical protein
MNRQRLLTWGGGLALLILVVLMAVQAAAARQDATPTLEGSPPLDNPAMSSASYVIPWDVLANGGGVMTSTNYRLNQTIGQASIGSMSSASFHAHAGFWQTLYSYLFLPMILR